MSNRIILAIESSCDETSAAIIKNDIVLSNIISSQTIHEQYGGVIPELASRAHLQAISLIVKQAMIEAQISYADLTSIAVTTEPGLAGALLVGSSFAKGLGLKLGIPVIPVHH
ncbi:MAG: tRNA (adenosine(37)-N6)-threonylcarbamoyltransferase complex transferase subunit TsaD, partial [Candidatus Kapaibacteriota bacterium]